MLPDQRSTTWTFHTVWNVKETDGPARNGDILGYARVSTAAQDAASQQDRLREAGASGVFVDVISGRRFQRPALAELIDHARPGDRLSVTRLDRLGRSLKELLDTVESPNLAAAKEEAVPSVPLSSFREDPSVDHVHTGKRR